MSYVPKVGDVVQIWIYEDIEATGTVVKVINWDCPYTWELEIEEDDGTCSSPWGRDCVRLLTPLERLI